jgi:hypothetical protein
MKKSLIVVLLIVLFISLTACDLVGEAARQSPKAYQEKCSDTDGGINLEEKGITKGLILDRDGNKKPVTKIDFCTKKGDLAEHYCSRDLVKGTIESCSEGKVCEDGACKIVGETPKEMIIGWQFHDDDVDYLSEMIDLAPEYHINHVELSHNMVWHTEDILDNPEKQVQVNNLINQAHQNGIELFIWTHEISYLPDQFFVNGKTDLDNPLLWEWLEEKYHQLFQAIPEVDGIVLTFSETNIPIYNDDLVITEMDKPERVTKLLNIVNGVCKEYGKKLWARTWAADEWVTEGVIAADENIWVENKNVNCDFCPYGEYHPNTGIYGDRNQIIEFDLNGQYLGRSWIPSPHPDFLKDMIDYAKSKDIDGYVGRVGTFKQDWEGPLGTLTIPNTHAINTPNEINLFAFTKIIENPEANTEEIWMEWTKKKYGEEAAPHIISAYKRTFDIISQLYFMETGEDSSYINMNTHSAISWWGIFDDPDRPEGGYWEKIISDPVFVAVSTGASLDEEVNQRFDPLIEMTELSLNDIEQAKPHLTPAQYNYLKESLERESYVLKVFKQIKKILISYGMVEINQAEEYQEPLNTNLQELLNLADIIEQKFGPDIILIKPEDIKTFVSGFGDHCSDGIYNSGEEGLDCGWTCSNECVFIEKEGELTQDEVWEGNIFVTDNVEVPKGITLTIKPGTIVKFKHSRDYKNLHTVGLSAFEGGIIKAIGTSEQQIWFTSDASDPINGDWNGISIGDSKNNNEFKHVIVEFAQLGISFWDSFGTVSNSIIRWSNSEGIYLERSKVLIEKNLIYGVAYNGIALENFNYGVEIESNKIINGHTAIHGEATEAVIKNNFISNNQQGITFMSGSEVIIKNNMIENNSQYAGSNHDNTITNLENNLIVNNKQGFLCEEGCNLIAHNNAFENNEEGNLFFWNHDSADIINNWWGTTNSEEVDSTIHSEQPINFVPHLMSNPVNYELPILDFVDNKNTVLGYIPGEPGDKFLYIYDEEDETRKVLKKIGTGLGFGWSLVWVDGYLWTGNANEDIKKINSNTGEVIDSILIPELSSARGIAFDGTYLWVNDFTNKVVFQVNPNTKEIVSTFSIPEMKGGAGASSIVWDGEYLYLKSWTEPKLYKIDFEGNVLEIINFESGGSGLTWDGSYFWTEGGKGIVKVNKKGQIVGEIYRAAVGPWAMAWQPADNEYGGYLWNWYRTSEMWDDAKIYQIEIKDDSLPEPTLNCIGFEGYIVPPDEKDCCEGLVATECTQLCSSIPEYCCDSGEMICLEE